MTSPATLIWVSFSPNMSTANIIYIQKMYDQSGYCNVNIIRGADAVIEKSNTAAIYFHLQYFLTVSNNTHGY